MYNNGQEESTERRSFELGLNLYEDKILSNVLKRLKKGQEIKDNSGIIAFQRCVMWTL